MGNRAVVITALALSAWASMAGCQGGAGSGPEVLEKERVTQGAGRVVHRVYTAAFEALEAALDSEDLLIAESTLNRLQQRLASDLAVAPTMAEALEKQDERSARTVSGEMPSRENVLAAQEMAAGFERVVQGRRRMEALDLTVELQRGSGTEEISVLLRAKSDWQQPLVLEPGPGSMEVLRTSLEPRSGGERREARIGALESGERIEIPAGGEAVLTIASLPVEVPVGAIATRMEVRVALRGGAVLERSLRLPMRELELPKAQRVDVAGWVPASLVSPVELVELVERGGAPLPAILERAVRIAPARRTETLDLLGAAARTLPVDAFSTAVPAVRWIVGTNEFGRDGALWRNWLIQRYEARVADGRITAQD